MSSGNDRITPSTSGERIASGTSNNKLVTQESSAARPPAADNKSNLPSHRRKCVQWCCPERCCTPLGFGLWVGFLLLIQAGPAAILYMDHRNSHRYGSTLSRYQTQQGMQSVLCKTVGIYSVNVTGKCENFLPCLKVKVIVYPTDSVKPIVNSTFLLHSEREHVIPRWNRLCFNLDICDIDAKDPWTEYRRKINIFKVLLSVKKQFKQSFICYFKEERRGYKLFPVVLLKLNTTFAEFFFWFVFPVTVLCLCWISIVFVCYWFCYPCDKEEPSMRTEYHEINTVDSDRNDYSANASGMGSGLPSAGHDGGGWPTRGPADGDTGNWPLYWR